MAHHHAKRRVRGTDRSAADSKSLQTRARLTDAAAEVLSRYGYAGFRLEAVARQAELRPPAIYYYYRSRDDLVEEVLTVGISGTRAHVCQLLDGLPADTTPLDRLMTAVEAHLTQVLTRSTYTTAFLHNVRQVPNAIRRRAVQEEQRYGQVWQRLFESASETFDPRVTSDLNAAQMFILGVLNWTAGWQACPPTNIEESVQMARGFVLRALTGAAPASDTSQRTSQPTIAGNFFDSMLNYGHD